MMGSIVLGSIGLLALFLLMIGLDSWLFQGRFLNRSTMSKEQFKQILESVLSQKDRPIADWEIPPQDWCNDKFLIPLKDPYLESLRQSIAQTIEANSSSEKISPQTVRAIETALSKLA